MWQVIKDFMIQTGDPTGTGEGTGLTGCSKFRVCRLQVVSRSMARSSETKSTRDLDSPTAVPAQF